MNAQDDMRDIKLAKGCSFCYINRHLYDQTKKPDVKIIGFYCRTDKYGIISILSLETLAMNML
jgi:hypothetical protein